MHIVLLCATQRGLRVYRTLREIANSDELTVCSFREEPQEPRYFDEIKVAAERDRSGFYEVRRLGSGQDKALWQSGTVDLLIAASWRYMVPPEVFRLPTCGSFVFHDSMLPKYRGFAPTIWAIVNGEDHTGVTLFRMTSEVDAGDIVDQERVGIGASETIATVLERTTNGYVRMLIRNLEALKAGTAELRAQDISLATYGRRRTADDNRIQWTASGRRTFDLIRAVTRPYPGAFTSLDGHRLIVWAAERPWRGVPPAPPGTVIAQEPGVGAHVTISDGTLLITEVQLGDDPVVTADRVLGLPGKILGA